MKSYRFFDGVCRMRTDRSEKAAETFNLGFNCAQAVLAGFAESIHLKRRDALRVAGALGGGMAHTGDTCGAVTGALMVLGLRFGKTEPGDDAARERAVTKGREFLDMFREAHGSCACRTLVGYDFSKPGEIEAARESGIFKTFCPQLVLGAAQILESLLEEERPARRRRRPKKRGVAREGAAEPEIEPPFPELDKDAVLALPIRFHEGPVHFVDFDEAAADACAILRREPVVGFDTETKPCFERGGSNPTALIQLAGATGVWLFSLQRLRDKGPLASLLQNPAVLKTGVALGDDVKKLQEIFPFEPAGFTDLAEMARSLGFKAAGLRNLAGNFLGFRISKSAKTSNWERWPLSPGQVKYAATDAWVSRELYYKLREVLDGRVSTDPAIRPDMLVGAAPPPRTG
jgi:C_GCAxxG_C_C family probable redox protein